MCHVAGWRVKEASWMHPDGDPKYPDLLIGDAIPEHGYATRRMGNCRRCFAAGPLCCNCMDCHEKGLSSRFELIRFSVGNLIVKPEDNQPNWNIFDMPTVNPMSMARFHGARISHETR